MFPVEHLLNKKGAENSAPLVPLRFSDLTNIAQLFTSSDHRL